MLPLDTNGIPVEAWLGTLPAREVRALAGYSAGVDEQHLFVVGFDGTVTPLAILPPQAGWSWFAPVSQHDDVVDVAAYFHPGDGRYHCFVLQRAGDVWEVSFASLDDATTRQELWIGKLSPGALRIAGFPMADKSQHLFIAGADGFVYPLELSSATNWQWTWRGAIGSGHQAVTGLCAYFHAGDQASHVHAVLATGDVWELRAGFDGAWIETWLGIQDGGARALAGHASSNGTQHLFGGGATGWVRPLQIGPPHWLWRWDERICSRHDRIVGMASYFHSGDGLQHVFVALQSGDIWEARFPLRERVATQAWRPRAFPISGWVGPVGSANATAKYDLYAAAGFTLALCSGNEQLSFDAAGNADILEACGALDVRMIVYDLSIVAVAQQSTAPLSAADKTVLDTAVAEYSGHSALAGYLLMDEVPAAAFPRMAEVVSYISAHDPGHICFAEAYPDYADAANWNLPVPRTYDQYIGDYAAKLGLPFLCFDHYPFQTNDLAGFYRNLRTVRQQAFVHSLPLWMIIQAHDVTETQMRWQAMQVLAFGGKGIVWYLYTEVAGVGSGIVDVNGLPTAHYADAERVNADVRTIGDYLLDAQSTAVYEVGSFAAGGDPLPLNGIVRVLNAVDVTVGMFSIPAVPDSSSATRLYVMLSSRDMMQQISVNVVFDALVVEQLDKALDGWVELNPLKGRREQTKFIVTIEPGDGVLFRLLI